MHKWTNEELDRLRELYKTHTRAECAEIMGLTFNNIQHALAKHLIISERKQGYTSKRRKAIGSETFDGRYVLVKVSENLWKTKQKVVWEEHYGKLKGDEVVLILNGNPYDMRVENLMKVTRSELARINQNGLSSDNTEIGRTKALLGKLLAAKGKKRRSNNG